ncbi:MULTISPECIES: GNAT family N-acetyltransferase [Bacillus]|uniref:GNAT family N-acetyltransferase n=1 Tax=Bacillus TaxID=1386 RepID=UPI002157BA41|nr:MULTISPECIES: GNAT family N-acetyltransferase [Bacillus]MCR6846563.1 GNAT family N-acetyltransferase [Bacillus sp. IBL03825]MCU5599635.1 GNAT family N-acetyltransferase [Bacillus wiedmannii]MED3075802.1 GNAT family N-acetyltransferase [Bacillus wiedmannii]
MNTYEFKHNIPTLQEYKYLCDSVGWSNYMNFEVAETSLKHSIQCITVKDNEQIIGMGRIVGDGSIYFYIQDIVVHPDYQKHGIGKEIMYRLAAYLHENAPDKAFVGLFASQGKESFYEKFDFKDYSPHMTGMFTVITKQ